MASTQISAAAAVKAFRTPPMVQTAKRIVVKDKATGKELPAFDVKDVSMQPEHVMAAAKYDDGRVVVVTIDGKRHVAEGGATKAE